MCLTIQQITTVDRVDKIQTFVQNVQLIYGVFICLLFYSPVSTALYLLFALLFRCFFLKIYYTVCSSLLLLTLLSYSARVKEEQHELRHAGQQWRKSNSHGFTTLI